MWRIAGTVLITLCAVMVILGCTVLSSALAGVPFLIYWSICILLTVGAIAVALADMVRIRRASKQTRRELFRRQFMSQEFVNRVRKKQKDKPDQP